MHPPERASELVFPVLKLIWRLYFLVFLLLLLIRIGLLPFMTVENRLGFFPSWSEPLEVALTLLSLADFVAALLIPGFALRNRVARLPVDGTDSDRELLKLYFPTFALQHALFLGVEVTGFVASIATAKPGLILPFAAATAWGLIRFRPSKAGVRELTGRSLT